MSRRTLLGGREELAATDRRIIHVRSGRCRDIAYGFLASVESGRFVDWKWLKRALYAICMSIVFAGIGLILPALVMQGASDVSSYSNSLVDQMVSEIIPPAYQGGMAQGMDIPGFSLMPGMAANASLLDLSGPASSMGQAIASVFTGLTALAVALSVLFLLIFALRIKRGLVMASIIDRHVFYYGKRQEKEVIGFIKMVRAEAGMKK